MENYKEYSYNAFVALKEQQKKNGFAFYQPHENAVIYANRYGDVLIWRSSKSGNTITIKLVKYPMPSELSADDYKWLRRIAKHKHWHGGVKKIDYYLTLTPDELDARGIDPYFYAWLAQYHYSKKSEVDYTETHRTILPEEEFNKVTHVAELLGADQETLIVSRIETIGDVKFDDWVSACAEVQEDLHNNPTLFSRVQNFVNEVLGNSTDEDVRYNAALAVHEILKNTLDEDDED